MSRFSADITEFANRTKVKGDKVIRKLGFDVHYGVLARSPVDKGRFRSSNRIGINATDMSVEPVPTEKTKRTSGDPPTGTEKAYANGKLKGVKFGMSIHESNNLPYGPFLENRGSPKAPRGVYRVTFDEIKANFSRTVASIKEEK